jgi:hypothetical protein
MNFNLFHFIDAFYKIDQIKDEELKASLKSMAEQEFAKFIQKANEDQETAKRLEALGLRGGR